MRTSLLQDPSFQRDVNYTSSFLKDPSALKNKTIMVTGATGLIGRLLVHTLATINRQNNAGITILALSRAKQRVEECFKEILTDGIVPVEVDLQQPIALNRQVDLVVHAAADTKSVDMVKDPVKVISSIYQATKNVMDFVRQNQVARVVYLSSMEVYGLTTQADGPITEDFPGRVNFNSVRSCYPEAKRLAEILVRASIQGSQQSAVILRLTQTFGSGVEFNDPRVFAEFTRLALQEQQIKLATAGETVRSYLAIRDAITAILTSLVLPVSDGEAEVFNVSNQDATVSILELAKEIAAKVPNTQITLPNEEATTKVSKGYAPTFQMTLSNQKLTKTGWTPSQDLGAMLDTLIATMTYQLENER